MPPPLRCPTTLASAVCTKHMCGSIPTSRSFSTTSRNDQRMTRARRMLFQWLSTQGTNFKEPRRDSTNYLNAYTPTGELKRKVDFAKKQQLWRQKEDADAAREGRPSREWPPYEPKPRYIKDGVIADPPEKPSDLVPFPLNRNFVSQPILDATIRSQIWNSILVKGKSVSEVSTEFGVEMARVAAVVRLKEVEIKWQRMGKPLAYAYNDAMLNMLPKTKAPRLDKGEIQRMHESINDLPVHRATGQQIFYPTSESRHFTRKDAAKVFSDNLLPADDRVPHPELAIMHKEINDGLSSSERKEQLRLRKMKEDESRERAWKRQAAKEAAVKRVDTGRAEYRFTEIKVDDVGKDGRGHKGTGWRYGVPLMDRSRGQVKIPTSVNV